MLAADTSRFTTAYTKIGLSPDGGASLLVNTLGLHRTLGLALLNPVLSALDLQALGLVHEVVPESISISSCADSADGRAGVLRQAAPGVPEQHGERTRCPASRPAIGPRARS